MSRLLDDLIKQSRADAAAYEEFLRKAEALAAKSAPNSQTGMSPSGWDARSHRTPHLPQILTQGREDVGQAAEQTADKTEMAKLAIEIDRTMREHAPAGWRGDQTREAQVKNALFPLLNRNREATFALFELIKNQRGYASGRKRSGLERSPSMSGGRKAIKHGHRFVYPPNGRVTLVTPNGRAPSGPRLRGLQNRLDSNPASQIAVPGQGDPPEVC